MFHQMEVRSLRLFFGIPLPPEARGKLVHWQSGQTWAQDWSKSDGLHLTLAFLGQRPPDAWSPLEALAASLTQRHPGFALASSGLGSFSRGESTRLIWLGLRPSPPLEAFVADLRETLERAGEAFDPKPFYPHVTLARFRQARRLDEFTDPPVLHFPADRLVLFESHPHGCYTELRSWPLRTV